MNMINLKNKVFTRKNLILFSIIFILIMIVLTLFFLLKHPDIQAPAGSATYSSNDSSVTITVPNNYEFSVVEDDSYILGLRSSKISSNIFVSVNSATNIRDIKSFVDGDKNDYISKFPNISNVSDISETTINGLTAYNYSFNYKTNMFVDVYWILKDEKIYVIDFNINTDNEDFYSHRKEILDKLKIV